MKKLSLIALIAAFGVFTAAAVTINVPFYNDGGTSLSAGYPGSGTATFIGIRNGDLDNPVQGSVYYYDNDGTDRTPDPFTFPIAKGSSVSFRPVATDTAEGKAGAAVPNKDPAGQEAGTATIVLEGSDPNQYSARVQVLNAAQSDSQYTLLPFQPTP